MTAGTLSTLAFASALSVVFTQPSKAAGVLHSVTGSGRVVEGGIGFSQSVAVHQAEDGALNGVVQVRIDLRAFGAGEIVLHGTPSCLAVDGATAWIGSTVTHSTSELIPAGTNLITLVQDLGGNGEDVLHGETEDFFPPGTTCENRPEMPATVVESGNLHVR